jgi:thioredoxin-related protein
MILSCFKRFHLQHPTERRKPLLLLLALFIAIPQATASSFFNRSSNNLKVEATLAQEQGKKALLIFYSTPDCPFCNRMKKTVLSQPEIALYFRTHFRLLEMNILEQQTVQDFSGKQTTAKAFAKKNHIRVTPTLVFYNTEGERLFKQVGIIADPKAFRWLGEYILEKDYQQESFHHYLRKKRNRQKTDPIPFPPPASG